MSVDLDIEHTFVRELFIILSNGADTITLVNRLPCTSNNIDVTLNDHARDSINSSCSAEALMR